MKKFDTFVKVQLMMFPRTYRNRWDVMRSVLLERTDVFWENGVLSDPEIRDFDEQTQYACFFSDLNEREAKLRSRDMGFDSEHTDFERDVAALRHDYALRKFTLDNIDLVASRRLQLTDAFNVYRLCQHVSEDVALFAATPDIERSHRDAVLEITMLLVPMLFRIAEDGHDNGLRRKIIDLREFVRDGLRQVHHGMNNSKQRG